MGENWKNLIKTREQAAARPSICWERESETLNVFIFHELLRISINYVFGGERTVKSQWSSAGNRLIYYQPWSRHSLLARILCYFFLRSTADVVRWLDEVSLHILCMKIYFYWELPTSEIHSVCRMWMRRERDESWWSDNILECLAVIISEPIPRQASNTHTMHALNRHETRTKDEQHGSSSNNN